jgi:hypothetical protein
VIAVRFYPLHSSPILADFNGIFQSGNDAPEGAWRRRARQTGTGARMPAVGAMRTPLPGNKAEIFPSFGRFACKSRRFNQISHKKPAVR